jgi:hypothetical protein
MCTCVSGYCLSLRLQQGRFTTRAARGAARFLYVYRSMCGMRTRGLGGAATGVSNIAHPGRVLWGCVGACVKGGLHLPCPISPFL